MAVIEAHGELRGGVLEREGPLAAIDEALTAAVNGSGTCLVLRGPGGIGKTRLLAEADRRARARQMGVLSARGAVLEGDYAFGIVRQLLEPAMRDERSRARMLTGGGETARRVLEIDVSGDRMAPDVTFAALYGLYWATANLAADRPLVICVDDLHWIDEPSLRFVDFVARRLEGLRVTMLLGWRSGEVGHAPSDEVLGELEAATLARVLEPLPLSEAAALELTCEQFSEPADPAFAKACHVRTGGNPFFLVELLRELHALGVSPTVEGVGRVTAAAPRSVSRVVLARLARLGAEPTALARALSVLGGRAPLADAAEVAGAERTAAAAAASTLVSAGMLRGAEELEFVHPLMRDAIASDTAAPAQAEAHRRAARILAAHGRGPDQVAAQVMASAPQSDRWAVERLRDAARAAAARGAPDAATALLRRALLEPPPPALKARVLAELGSAEAALDSPEAIRHLADAVAALPGGPERARAALLLARRQWLDFRMDAVYATVRAGREDLRAADRELALRLDAIELSARSHDPGAGTPIPERLTRLAKLRGMTAGERAVLSMVAFEIVKTGGPATDALELVDRAIGDLDRTADTQALVVLIGVLHWTGRIARAVELATTAIDQARSIGSAMLFAEMSAARALAHWRGGNLVEAQADAHQALQTAGSRSGQMYGIATHALLGTLTERGELTEAQALAEDFFADRGRSHNVMWPVVACSYGALLARLGQPDAALARLTGAGALVEATGCVHPAAGEWRQPAALILAAEGSRDRARAVLAPALHAAERSQGPYELAISLRAAALIEEPVDIELLRRALTVVEASELQLHHALLLIDLGRALRRSGYRRDAREPLAGGMEIAHRCGAMPLRELARTELLAAGARPRKAIRTGAEALTPSERRVTGLARDGLSNREIAQQLFVSPRTVEAQLRSAYSKLGISSRAALAGIELGRRET